MNYRNYKTIAEAVEASIGIWKQLAEIGCIKEDLSCYVQLYTLNCGYPICDFFNFTGQESICRKCPLESCISHTDYWYSWRYANSVSTRKRYAQLIVQKLKDYFVYEQMYVDYTETEIREQ